MTDAVLISAFNLLYKSASKFNFTDSEGNGLLTVGYTLFLRKFKEFTGKDYQIYDSPSDPYLYRNATAEESSAYYQVRKNAVKQFMDDAVQFCKDNGYVTTIMGRKRYIKEIKATQFMVRQAGERLAMNSPIQGSAADIIKIAMIKVAAALRDAGLKSKLILQIHDELIINAYPDELETVKTLLVENMESAYKMKVDLKADLNEGSNWYELK